MTLIPAQGLPADSLRTRLLPLLEASPLQAGPLYTSYKDLALSVEWHDLRAVVLPGTEWTVILGHKNRADLLRVVLPLPLHTTALRPSVLKLVFSSIAALTSSDIPAADEPLVPTIAAVQQEMAMRREAAQTGPEEAAASISIPGPPEQAEHIAAVATPVSNSDIDRETLYLAITTSDSTVVYYKLSKGIRKPADIPDE